jgi:Mg2+/Co2+ transporter CorB
VINNYLKISLSYINGERSVVTVFVYKFGDIFGIVTFSFVLHSEQVVGSFHAFELSFLVT